MFSSNFVSLNVFFKFCFFKCFLRILFLQMFSSNFVSDDFDSYPLARYIFLQKLTLKKLWADAFKYFSFSTLKQCILSHIMHSSIAMFFQKIKSLAGHVGSGTKENLGSMVPIYIPTCSLCHQDFSVILPRVCLWNKLYSWDMYILLFSLNRQMKVAGLPDFSWRNIPKWGYQIATKLPNGPKMFK
jgi:hypothetical protein